MKQNLNHVSKRRAFTLVELLVATALAVGLMWLLAESFKMGLDFTRQARSTGQMMGQLDGAGAVLARDIQQEIFLPDDNLPNRGVRLSDQRLDLLTSKSPSAGWAPPPGGFFRIISPYSTLIQTDSDGYGINTAGNHALHFTSILSPNDRNLYTATVGNTVYQSRAAEIAYLLVDTGQFTTPVGGQRLYNLVRRQRLAARTKDEVSGLMPIAPATVDSDVIAGAGTGVFSLVDLRNPANRLQVVPANIGVVNSPLAFPISSNRFGEDLLVSDVLSFEVLVDFTPNTAAPSSISGFNVPSRPFGTPMNSEFPFDNLAVNAGQNSGPYGGPGVFDTWYPAPAWNVGLGGAANANKLPLGIRVKAIQVTTRIWDRKTKQARQNTWKFAM